jgi:hypothetical protein
VGASEATALVRKMGAEDDAGSLHDLAEAAAKFGGSRGGIVLEAAPPTTVSASLLVQDRFPTPVLIVSYLETIVLPNKKLSAQDREILQLSRMVWESSANADNAEKRAAIRKKNKSFCTIS